MIRNIIAIFSILLYVACFGEAGLFDGNHHTCGLSDHECHRQFFQRFGSFYSPLGIKELNIPVLDPWHIFNTTVSVENVMNLTLVEGYASGIANCLALKYDTFIENRTKVSQLLCDNITIWGTYDMDLVPLIKNSLGDVIHGHGKVRVEIINWYLDLHYPFAVEKRDDNQTYIRCLFDNVTYTQKVDDIKLDIENVKLGDIDISQTIIDLATKDGSFFAPTFGKIFTDKALKFYALVHNLFFNQIPTKFYITEDMSNYV